MRELTLYNFFPKHLNLYGDRGNVHVLFKRCEWRDIKLTIKEVTEKNLPSLDDADILYIGGGGDREQNLISQFFGGDLSNNTKSVIQDGAACLAICGGYQLLGDYYETVGGTKIEGIGLFDFYTKAEKQRLVGDVLVDSDQYGTVIGFENHAGQTFHNGTPIGTVKKGYGNNTSGKTEGYQNDHFIGTYLHGPFLPKNPKIADQIIRWALERKYGEANLSPLDDSYDEKTRLQATKQLEKRS